MTKQEAEQHEKDKSEALMGLQFAIGGSEIEARAILAEHTPLKVLLALQKLRERQAEEDIRYPKSYLMSVLQSLGPEPRSAAGEPAQQAPKQPRWVMDPTARFACFVERCGGCPLAAKKMYRFLEIAEEVARHGSYSDDLRKEERLLDAEMCALATAHLRNQIASLPGLEFTAQQLDAMTSSKPPREYAEIIREAKAEGDPWSSDHDCWNFRKSATRPKPEGECR